jgi:hypothetical protein
VWQGGPPKEDVEDFNLSKRSQRSPSGAYLRATLDDGSGRFAGLSESRMRLTALGGQAGFA